MTRWKYWPLLWKGAWALTNMFLSALIGALVGSWYTAAEIRHAQEQAELRKQELIFPTSEEGYSQPIPVILDLAGKPESGFRMSVHPDWVEDILVCEFARVSGSTRDRVFAYLDRNATCFTVREARESEFVIGPNLRSGDLVERPDGRFCKCPQ